MFRFLPRDLNWFPKIVMLPFLSAFSCVLIVLSSRATKMSALASWDSIGESEMHSVLKLCPPLTKDW